MLLGTPFVSNGGACAFWVEVPGLMPWEGEEPCFPLPPAQLHGQALSHCLSLPVRDWGLSGGANPIHCCPPSLTSLVFTADERQIPSAGPEGGCLFNCPHFRDDSFPEAFSVPFIRGRAGRGCAKPSLSPDTQMKGPCYPQCTKNRGLGRQEQMCWCFLRAGFMKGTDF